MKIYLAGPMRGIRNYNFPAFDYAATKLLAQGHDVYNPAEADRQAYGPEIEDNPTGDFELSKQRFPDFSVRDFMLRDTEWICKHGEAIALLPGWKTHPGSNTEYWLGKTLGLSIILLGEEYLPPTNEVCQ